jgi:thiamine biosynthesis lipoprotein
VQRYQQHFKALGSDVLLTLVTSEPTLFANELFGRLRESITSFEGRFSRFLPGSELTQFNNLAGERVTTSHQFHKLLSTAKSLSLQTDGLYNPFVLPALQKAGYLASWGDQVVTPATSFADRKVADIHKLILGDTWAQIPSSAALDFGGIGKGYLLDELAKQLTSKQLHGYFLSLGGDIITSGYDLDHKPWEVGVLSALDPTKTVACIPNRTGGMLAIATSGVTKRKGTKDGKSWHHIIDPRTGESAITNILTVTVTARDAVLADVYAKCIVIDGSARAAKYRNEGHINSFLLQFNNATIAKSSDEAKGQDARI